DPAEQLVSFLGTQRDGRDVSQRERLGRVRGNVDDVRIFGIDAHAAAVIVFGGVKRPAAVGDESPLPLGAGPAGVVVIDAVVVPAAAGDVVHLHLEDADGVTVPAVVD